MDKERKRANQSIDLLLAIDRNGEQPIQKQVANQLVGLIRQGTLPPGAALPPSRRLAESLGVNRTTVVRAYLDLWSLGYIESRPGSYTRVRRRAELATKADRRTVEPFDWPRRLNREAALSRSQWLEAQSLYRAGRASPGGGRDETTVDFTPHFYAPDDERPLAEFRKILNRVMADQGSGLADEYDPRGHLPLRRYLAQRVARFGINTTPGEIILTGGLLDSLGLLARVLLTPGAAVLVESPTAGGIVPLLRFHGARVEGVPMSRNGLDLAALRRKLTEVRPAFLLTMPNFQIPTGIVTSQAHREELLRLCQAHGLPIVESGFEEEMACFGKAVLPIKSMDRRQQVVHLGAFSRVLMVGAQVGWIIAHERLTEGLAAARSATAGSPSGGTVFQAAMLDFCLRGRYDVHVKRMLAAFRRRMRKALRLLKRELADELEWIEPGGGYVIWAKCKNGLKKTDISEHLHRFGVEVSPGNQFLVNQKRNDLFRISISSVGESQIVEGVRRMKKALISLKRAKGPW